MPPANSPARNKRHKRLPLFPFTHVGTGAQGRVRGRVAQPEESSLFVAVDFLPCPKLLGEERGREKSVGEMKRI